MAQQLDSIRVLGVHPVVPTVQQFEKAVETMYGEGMRRLALSKAKKAVREHFDNVYLLEIEISPPGSVPDWSAITQPIAGESKDAWQVPFDEQPLDDDGRRWTFFFHYLDFDQPLRTQLGEIPLPRPVPTPEHLRHITYEVPG